MGFILLAGGNEFQGQMETVDRHALILGGGPGTPVRILPAAAAPDGNHRRAGENGVRWFQGLGATDVHALAVIDRASADRADFAAEIEAARLVFLLGGFPGYLAETLAGTKCGKALLGAFRNGAVIAGSSAGAMVVCGHYFDPQAGRLRSGLGLVQGVCVLPHHARDRATWTEKIGRLPPGVVLLGIDEETGLVNDDPEGLWSVYGPGAVTLYTPPRPAVFRHGQQVQLPVSVARDL